MSFKEFNLSHEIMKGLEDLKYHEPTEVQKHAIPTVMKGKDILVQSKTGSGKTSAFGIPMLERIQGNHVQAVVLVPTRELAMQVCEEIQTVGKYMKAKPIPVYGGQPIERQLHNLPGKQIIVATPGRFIDLFKRRAFSLTEVHTLVLDEADRMLDMGFEKDLTFIMQHIPKQRQTLLFSATMPEQIKRIAMRYMNNPEHVFLSKDTVDTAAIKQTYYGVADNRKLEALAYILDVERPNLAIVFCNRKHSADFTARVLTASGFKAQALHGNLTQSRRDRVMEDFRAGKFYVLVASDVAARGLDIDNITHVINFDLPDDPNTYVHRIGRTGRNGNTGKAISIITNNDRRLWDSIENKIRVRLEREHVDSNRPMPKLVIPAKPERSFHGGGRRFGGGGHRGGPRGGPRSHGPGGHGGGYRGGGRSGGSRQGGGGFRRRHGNSSASHT